MDANCVNLSILVAMDKHRAIGKDNRLPWHIPAELAYFRKTTMGHTVVMGRKTFESIGKPLEGRTNIVFTRNRGYTAAGCSVKHSVSEVLAGLGTEEAFVIGGAETVRAFLPHTNKLYITRIEHEFSGDTFFPELDFGEWELISERQGVKNEDNPYTYYYQIYKRARH